MTTPTRPSMTLWRLYAVAILGVCTLFAACGQSREDYRDDLAQTLCDRADECGDIGEGRDFTSYDDCLIERRSNINNAWPDDRCGGSSINDSKFDDCIERAKNFPCQGGLGDIIAFFVECSANNVCIDARE